jgi:hypothetical protein
MERQRHSDRQLGIEVLQGEGAHQEPTSTRMTLAAEFIEGGSVAEHGAVSLGRGSQRLEPNGQVDVFPARQPELARYLDRAVWA